MQILNEKKFEWSKRAAYSHEVNQCNWRLESCVIHAVSAQRFFIGFIVNPSFNFLFRGLSLLDEKTFPALSNNAIRRAVCTGTNHGL